VPPDDERVNEATDPGSASTALPGSRSPRGVVIPAVPFPLSTT